MWNSFKRLSEAVTDVLNGSEYNYTKNTLKALRSNSGGFYFFYTKNIFLAKKC